VAAPSVIVVMGVSGSGKTTVGRALARDLGWEFVDGDELHSPENVAKMARGVPLDDADRAPWLAAIAAVVAERVRARHPAVIACSALRRVYRDEIRGGLPEVAFAYLRGEESLLRQRLRARPGHFAHEDLLASQLATLEEPAPDEGIPSFSIDEPPDAITARIRGTLVP